MDAYEKYVEQGKSLGLEGTELVTYVREREQLQHDRDERTAQLEIDRLTLENDKLKIEKKHERKMAKIEKNKSESIQTNQQLPQIRIPMFDENKDSLEGFLERFERVARGQKWPEDLWASHLSSLLRGKALETYSLMNAADALDYAKLKVALMKRFQVTEEGLRLKFRSSRPERGETPLQFVARLNALRVRWFELAKVEECFEKLTDLMMQEQFLSLCSKELRVFIRESQCKTIDEVTAIAETFVEAHGITSFTQSNKFNRSSDTPVGKSDDNMRAKSHSGKDVGRSKVTRMCYVCSSPTHLARDCKMKQSKYSSGQSSRASAQALSKGQSPKRDSANACAGKELQKCCINKCGQVALKCGHELELVNLACGQAQELSVDMPVMQGTLSSSGKRVSVLRDTGCTTCVVRSRLVEANQATHQKRDVVLIDGTVRTFQVVKIYVDSPYFVGEVEALSMENPLYDVVVGNIPGARNPDSPDPNWIPNKNERAEECHAVVTRSHAKAREKQVPPLKSPSVIPDLSPQELIEQQRTDDSLLPLWNKAKKPDEAMNSRYIFVIHKDRLYRQLRNMNHPTQGRGKRLLLVPKTQRHNVMRIAHESLLAGHQGVKKTMDKIMTQFFWPGISVDVMNFCRSCDICQRTIAKGRIPKAPLGRMPMIDVPFQRIAIDLVGPLFPRTERGNRYILTVVDTASRFPEATPLRGTTTEEVAEALVDIYSRVGIPREVLSDLGAQLTSDLMKEVNRLLSIKQLTTTPYHPICNGMVERFNGTLKTMLKRMCAEQPKHWDRYLPALLFAVRESPNESIGFSPFEMLYGRAVRGPMSILRELWTSECIDPETKTTYEYVLDLKDRLQETCKIAQQTLSDSSARYKKYYDRKSRPRFLQVGDKVLVLRPTDTNKLLMQWKGPFTVVRKYGDNDYEIDMGGKVKGYHINLLKRYFSRQDITQGLLDSVTESNDDGQTVVAQSAAVSDMDDGAEVLVLPSTFRKETERDVNICGDLGETQREEIDKMISNYQEVFSDVPKKTDAIECQIKLTSDDPIRSKAYPIPQALRNVVKKEIEEMLSLGIIEPSQSPYAHPTVVVNKKDGGHRICIDFRRLNKVVVFDPEPVPNPTEIFAKLTESQFVSKIDLARGYWQIPMATSDKEKTAFVTPDGHYQFRYMPFGLVNASAVFTRMMRKLFENTPMVVNYIDDILIHTKTWDEHLTVLAQVLEVLRSANLAARPKKCFLGYQTLEFLGHEVGGGSLKTSPQLLEKIQACPRPNTKKQVRSLLGLAGYYQKFVDRYAEVTAPLSDLVRKGQPEKVKWGEAQEQAYMKLKKLLAEPPILRLPDFCKQFVLRTDASGVGLGAVLMQEYDGQLFPLGYASRKLLPREQNYSTIEQECLAIVWAISKFEFYLYGRTFEIHTDHMPLTYIDRAKVVNKRIMRWALFLQEYRFRVVAVRGRDNHGPDFLSRVSTED